MDRDELLPKMSDDTKEYVDRVLEVFNAPFARELGIEIESVSKEEVISTLSLKPLMINSMGRIHGGVIYSLMDHTFAIISNMVNDATGQSMEVKYYRPASTDLRCIAKPVNVSRSLGVYDVRVYSTEGKLLASSTSTSFVIKRNE